VTAADPTAAALRFDALGDEIWRQYVDLDSQAFGPLAYDLGLGKGSVEPGYLAAMARGHRLVRAQLGRPLTEDMYRSLVPACLPSPPSGGYRSCRSWIHVHRDRLEPGIEDVWREHGAFGDASVEGVAPSKLRLCFAHLEPEAIQARVAEVIARYGAESAAATDWTATLLSIARLHQALELLHPTNDGNTRRHALVLYKLLVDAGERPAVLTEINDVYVRTPATWARMIAEGMRRHEAIADAIAHGEDVEQTMRAFDARGVVGQRGARRLGESRTRYRDVVFVPFAGDD
jgi:hypothetical protein